MPDNFTSELVDSAGEIFATDAIGEPVLHSIRRVTKLSAGEHDRRGPSLCLEF